jgi:hypothetical protein
MISHIINKIIYKIKVPYKIIFSLIFFFFFFFVSFAKENKNIPFQQNSERVILQKNEIEIEKLKSEIIFLKEKVNDSESDFEKSIEKQNAIISEKLNLYTFFCGLILTLIGWAINFFGKAEIKRRVEQIIKETAETHVINKTNQVISERITEEYTAKIIREKGEPEIIKRLTLNNWGLLLTL